LAQQNSPSASASSAANSAGTTVNNQNNSQINTSTFYGFGPGINCPTTTFSVSGFGGSGTGSSGGDVLGATVDSNTYGGIVALTVPLGFTNAGICSKIGKAQAAAIEAQVAKARAEHPRGGRQPPIRPGVGTSVGPSSSPGARGAPTVQPLSPELPHAQYTGHQPRIWP
jgi:hypothetical protein